MGELSRRDGYRSGQFARVADPVVEQAALLGDACTGHSGGADRRGATRPLIVLSQGSAAIKLISPKARQDESRLRRSEPPKRNRYAGLRPERRAATLAVL
ncbi:hypothetical protein AEB_P0566 [Altererythrobacter sp. B11]|nr:hypothetical protein AEB_P0566 [Altererythrobacter sp. B11]